MNGTVNCTPSPRPPNRPDVRTVASPADLVWNSTPQRFRQVLSNGTPLDLFILNQRSETLVVSLHGALDRKKYAIPRFERVKSIEQTDNNLLAIADPSLHLHRRLELAWYTGTYSLDLFPVLADWITAAASLADARHIVLTGSSGGGFAALQTSTLIPNAVACVFNPQTAINRYVHPRWGYAAQERYLHSVMPQLKPMNDGPIGDGGDWTLPLGDRLSAVRRYSQPQETRVIYFTNTRDFHHVSHFEPFQTAFAGNAGFLRAIPYQQDGGHPPPTRGFFIEALEQAVDWAKNTPRAT